MGTGFKSTVINVFCALAAYTGSRFIWAEKDDGVPHLHWELVTFAAFYLVLQALIRGWRLAKKGKES